MCIGSGVETPNNFCPSRFLKCVHICIFFKSQICTGRKEIVCLHFNFIQNANLDTLDLRQKKVYGFSKVFRIRFSSKTKI